MNDHAARRDAGYTNILAAIDDVTTDRCAWETCHAPLGPDAPSRDFCSRGHQWLWTQAYATDPEDVCSWADADQNPEEIFDATGLVPVEVAGTGLMPLANATIQIGSTRPDGSITWRDLPGVASVSIVPPAANHHPAAVSNAEPGDVLWASPELDHIDQGLHSRTGGAPTDGRVGHAGALAAALHPGFELLRTTIEELYPIARDAGLLPDVPPTDPRERALWLRRNRNTGPQPRRQRPPRNLPRGGAR